MSECKECGAKYSFWSGRPDHLCKQCGEKADQLAKQEAERQEAERKRRVLEEAKKNIDRILEELTDEPPLAFTFVNRNITTKKQGGGLLGVVVGGALGGVGGAMVGGALTPAETYTHVGELGVVVVTKARILMASCSVSFLSAAGNISSDHIEFLLEQMRGSKAERTSFDIRRTQHERSAGRQLALLTERERCRFLQSDLFVNGDAYEIPSVAKVNSAIDEQGSLVTPGGFLDRLEEGECPISEQHWGELADQDGYIATVRDLIIRRTDRNELARNFACLAPPVRQKLIGAVQSKGAGVGYLKARMAVSGAAAVAGVVGITLTYEGACFLCVLGTIVAAIMCIASAVSLGGAEKCREILAAMQSAASVEALPAKRLASADVPLAPGRQAGTTDNT